ncbi:MAG: LamG domain-containing protein [Cyanobacteria bacterium P01_F01_bin.143]
MENPLDFFLYYTEEKSNLNSLFFQSETTVDPVILEIKNQTTNKVSLTKPQAKTEVSADNCHLKISLPKAALADPTIIKAKDKNWSLVMAEDDANYDFYLLYRLGRILTGTSKDKPLTVTLENFLISPDFEDETIQILFTYGALIHQDGKAIETDGVYAFENQTVTINNMPNSAATKNSKTVKAGVPLYASFASTSSVLNDGITPNQLVLRIVNVSGETLSLDEEGELTLNFDYGDKDQSYALATEGQMHGFEVAVDDVKNWQVHPKPTANSPVSWSIKPKSEAVTLPPRGAIEITVSSIVTGHGTGGSNLYLGYKNFGGYGDGELVVTIEKNSLLFSSSSGDDGSQIATERVYYDSAYILELDEGAIPPPPPKPSAPVVVEEVEEEISNGVIEFDGTSNFIALANNIKITGPFTLEAWICPSLVKKQGDPLFGILAPNEQFRSGAPFFCFRNDLLVGGFSNHELYASTTSDQFQVGEWYHVAITFDGRTVVVYRNGVELDSKDCTEAPKNEPLNRIGVIRWNTDNFFPGKISEVRVWAIAKTEEELKSTMRKRLKGNEDRLVGYWQLNEIKDGKVKDLTSNGNDGTICGAKLVEAPDLDLKPLPKPKPKAKPQPKIILPPQPAPPITNLAKKGQIDLMSATTNDDVGFAAPAVGVLIKSEQSWYSQGVTPGQLLHSVALAPGESTNVAVTGLTAVDSSDRNSLNTIINGVETNTTFDGSATKQQIASSGGVATMNVGRSDGGKNISNRSNRDITTSIHQYASQIRTQIPLIREGVGAGDPAGSVVTNNNKMHALSVQYFEAVHNYQVVTKTTQCDRLLFIPMKPLDLKNPGVMAKCRAIVAQAKQKQAKSSQIQITRSINPTTVNYLPPDSNLIPEGEGIVSLKIAGEKVYTIPIDHPKLTKISWKFIAKEDDEFWYHPESSPGNDTHQFDPAINNFWFEKENENGESSQSLNLPIPTEILDKWREFELKFPDVPLWKGNNSLHCDFAIKPRFYKSQAPGTAKISYYYHGSSDFHSLGGSTSNRSIESGELVHLVDITDRVKVVFLPRLRQAPHTKPHYPNKIVVKEDTGEFNSSGWQGPYEAWILRPSDPEPQVQITLHLSNGSEEISYTHVLEYSPAWAADKTSLIDFEMAGETTNTETPNIAGEEAANPVTSTVNTTQTETIIPQATPLSLAEITADPLAASQLIWANTPPETWIQAFAGLNYKGESVSDRIDPKPAAIVGNYVGFRWYFESDRKKLDWLLEMKLLEKDFRAWLQANNYTDTDIDLTYVSNSLKQAYLNEFLPEADKGTQETHVPIPTGGIVGDAVLGLSNCAEELDPTRIKE